jgi:type III secretory pathway component EscR
MLGLCLVAVLAVVVPSITASESESSLNTSVNTKVVRNAIGTSHAPPRSALGQMSRSLLCKSVVQGVAMTLAMTVVHVLCERF